MEEDVFSEYPPISAFDTSLTVHYHCSYYQVSNPFY